MKCLQGITMLTCVILSVASAENGIDKDALLKTCFERERKRDSKVSDKGIQGICDIKVKEEIGRMTTEAPTTLPTARTIETGPPQTLSNTITLPATKNPPTIANESTGVSSSDSSPSTSKTNAAPSTKNATEAPASTIGVTDAFSNSPVSNAQPTPAPESGDCSTLRWTLPLLAVALVVMTVGVIFINRYTKKAGYCHSNKPNGDTVNTKVGTDSSA